MNFRELSKEKKQYIFLGVVVGLTSLFVLFNAAFLPMKEKWANTKAECQMLQNDLDQAHRMIKNERTLRANLAESSEVLQKAAGEFLPSMENRLSWATQKMYANSRIVGVEISSVSEVEGAAVLQAQTKDGRPLRHHTIKLEGNGHIARFVRERNDLQSLVPGLPANFQVGQEDIFQVHVGDPEAAGAARGEEVLGGTNKKPRTCL